MRTQSVIVLTVSGIVMLFLVALLAGATPGAARAEAVAADCDLAAWSRRMVTFMARDELAQAAPRADLVHVILALQDAKFALMFDPAVAGCGALHGDTVAFMALMERAYRAFYAEADDWDAKLDLAVEMVNRVRADYEAQGGDWAQFQRLNATALGNIGE